MLLPVNPLVAASRLLPRLPIGLADQRFANALFRRQGAPVLVRARLSGGAALDLDTAQWPEAQALVLGRYDASTVAFVVAHLSPGGTFFDVGAHVGLISFQVLATCPTAKVHAFEPHPVVAERYDANNALNGGGARLARVGLSSDSGFLPFDIATHSIGSSGDARIPVVTLDDYIAEHAVETIDVLKIDVEGHELAVLEGARSALRAGRIRAITLEAMEVHGDTSAARELLLAAGYHEEPMPDPRPPWLANRRPWRPGNAAFLRRRS